MKNLQTCNRCVMNNKIKDITFNSEGNCNYCEEFLIELKNTSNNNSKELEIKKNKFISKVIKKGKNKKYDCIIFLNNNPIIKKNSIKIIKNNLNKDGSIFDYWSIIKDKSYKKKFNYFEIGN